MPWLLIALLVTFASLFLFLPAGAVPWPDCLVYKWTGWHCPGCGGTRAARSLVAGEWLQALKLNLMVYPVLIGSAWTVIAFVVNRLTGREWWNPARLGWRTMVALLIVLLVFTILRNLEFGSFLRP